MKSRIITVFLLITMLLSIAIMPADAAFVDIDGQKYQSAVELLHALGLIEGKTSQTFDPAGVVTRAEMATLTSRILGVKEMGIGREIFSDVPGEHWAYNAVSTAYDLGIINGIGDGSFHPETSVTLMQATKMLVCTLGYEVKAEALGGYPAGYLATASELGLFRGVAAENNLPLSRGEMAILVRNAVNTDVFAIKTYGDDMSYGTASGITPLKAYLHVETRKGQITATPVATLSGRLMKEGFVELGGESLEVGKTDAASYIGCEVTAYLHEGETEILALETRAEILHVARKDVDPRSDYNTLYYMDGENEKKASITGATLIFNGKVKADWTADTLRLGNLRLISEDKNTYGIIFVDAYETAVVQSVNTYNDTIQFKEAVWEDMQSLDLRETQELKEFRLANGEAAKAADCHEWMILSVAKSEDGEILRVICSTQSVTGTVTEISDDEVTIGDTVYTVSESLQTSNKLIKPTLGVNGIFYLDTEGRIAAVNDEVDTGEKYGYLAATEVTKGLNSKLRMKIFTEDGEMRLFEAADKVKVFADGVERTVDGAKVISDVPALHGADGKVAEQLIVYELNGEGAVSSITVATDGSVMDRDTRAGVFSLDYTAVSPSMFVGGATSTFEGKYKIIDSTILFNVPPQYSAEAEQEYKIMNGFSASGRYTNLLFYDLNRDNTVSATVLKSVVESTVTTDNMVGLVTSVHKGLAPSGEEVTILKLVNYKGIEETLYSDGEVKALTTNVITDLEKEPEKINGVMEREMDISKLRPGDIVQYAATGQGYISALAIRLRGNTPAMWEHAYKQNGELEVAYENFDYFNQICLYGKVEAASEHAVVVNVYYRTNGGALSRAMTERTHSVSGATVILYDTEREQTEIISADEIYKDDTVFILRNTYYPRMIVVYR